MGAQEQDYASRQRVDGFEKAMSKRIAALEDRIDANDQEIEAVKRENEALREENDELRAQVEMLRTQVSVVNPDESWTATKREVCQRVLRSKLWNRAQNNGGKAQMRYKDVMNALVDSGVENVHPPECYNAMDDVEATDGFELTTDANGEKVVRLDISETPVEGNFVFDDPTKSAGVNATAGVNQFNNGDGSNPRRTDDQNGGENNQG